jgi:hypothetical protein
MINTVSRLLDRMSNYLAHRKGLLPMLGLILILVNLGLQFTPGLGWVTQADLFLHLGLIVAILGLMLAWAL